MSVPLTLSEALFWFNWLTLLTPEPEGEDMILGSFVLAKE